VRALPPGREGAARHVQREDKRRSSYRARVDEWRRTCSRERERERADKYG